MNNGAALASLPIYRTDEVRRIESLAQATAEPPALMERAGLAAAELARVLVGDSRKPVLVLAGPGNNGGDGFVVARQLKQWWHPVNVVFAGERAKLSQDAGAAFDAWQAIGGEIYPDLPAQLLSDFGLIVDALFGIGLERELSGRYAEWVSRVNASGTNVLAVDLPSGLHADSGRILGSAVRARHTATFIALKPGLLTLDGPDCCGEIHVRDLGLDVEALLPAPGRLIGQEALRNILPRRALNSHKGTFGNIGVLGGALGMTGAALLAGRAALQLGAGRIYVGLIGADAPRLDPLQPELMLRSASEVLAMEQLSCLVLGPGLSQSISAHDAVRHGLDLAAPLIVDADALSLLGAHAELAEVCRSRSAPTVLTPHPAEAARLLHCSTADVQRDRVSAALALADRYRASVALKGVGTVVAYPDNRYRINPTGNPGLASAGMGDVLSGMLGALIAQGAQAEAATATAVHLHGAAADRLYELQGGPIGITATEVTAAARALLNRCLYSA
jgi:hydroxyethylthiazole kinase-like uncharacterized protein yjeF